MSIPESRTPSVFRATVQGLTLLVLLEIGVGIFLATRYRPEIASAHDSVQVLRESLAPLVNFHYWASAAMIVFGGLLVVGMVFAGWYENHKAAYLGALLFAACAIGLQITGNLLPFDRHDVQTAVIEASIAGRTPVIGQSAQQLMLQGSTFSEQTLQGWNFAHQWILTPAAAFGLLLLTWGQWTRKGSNFLFALPPLIPIVLSFVLVAPYGPAATPDDFNSQDAAVSWYVWPLHGALKAFDAIANGNGWIGSALLPLLLGLYLLLLPVIGKKLHRVGVATIFVLFMGGWLTLSALYAGPPAPAYGLQEVPEEPVAPVKDTGPITVDQALAAKGHELFKAQPCSGCHRPDGKGGLGGPNLTGVWKKRPEPAWFKKFIRNPTSVKPNTIMPAFPNLTDEQLDALIEWIKSLSV